jgi:hypothetical protein
MEKELYIFSGSVNQGKVGDATGLLDSHGNELRVGDIVAIWTETYTSPNLTAVVKDENGAFIMGLRTAVLSEWGILRVKSCEDCIDGEKWRAYGFNYSAL